MTMTAVDLLAFESRPWGSAGAKERAITEQFGNVTRYYQQLLHATADPAAVAAHPIIAGRLRRIADRKAALKRRDWT